MHTSNSTSPLVPGATSGPHGFVVRAAAFDLARHSLDQSSLRNLAPIIGLSASTLHRLDQHRRRLDGCCPELSTFFLSPEGADFLCRMLLALHLVFGLMGANGCALIAPVFESLRVGFFRRGERRSTTASHLKDSKFTWRIWNRTRDPVSDPRTEQSVRIGT